MTGACRKCGVLLDPDCTCLNGCHTTPLRSAPSGQPHPRSPVVSNGDRPAGRQVMVTLASQIKPRPVRWLWPDRIPAGALTLLAGP